MNVMSTLRHVPLTLYALPRSAPDELVQLHSNLTSTDFTRLLEIGMHRYSKIALELLVEGLPETGGDSKDKEVLVWNAAAVEAFIGTAAAAENRLSEGRGHFELAACFMRTLVTTKAGASFAGVKPSVLAKVLEIEASILRQAAICTDLNCADLDLDVNRFEVYMNQLILLTQLHVEARARVKALRKTQKYSKSDFDWKIWCKGLENAHEKEAEELDNKLKDVHIDSGPASPILRMNADAIKFNTSAVLLRIRTSGYKDSGLENVEDLVPEVTPFEIHGMAAGLEDISTHGLKFFKGNGTVARLFNKIKGKGN